MLTYSHDKFVQNIGVTFLGKDGLSFHIDVVSLKVQTEMRFQRNPQFSENHGFCSFSENHGH